MDSHIVKQSNKALNINIYYYTYLISVYSYLVYSNLKTNFLSF